MRSEYTRTAEHSAWTNDPGPGGGGRWPAGVNHPLQISRYTWEKMKWWEIDTATFRSLSACRYKYGLDKWMFEIEAVDVSEGGASAVYSISPSEPLSALDLARISSRSLFQWGEDA